MRHPLFAYQERARCYGCCGAIERVEDVIFASLCGHPTCPSTTWHYNHLMECRETAERNCQDPYQLNEALGDLLERMRER